MAATMLVGALVVVTFGTASLLQGAATAHAPATVEPFVVEAVRRVTRPVGTGEREVQARERGRSAAQVASR